MNTLYLHVGPHKTGTTLLQKFMMDNQPQLFQDGLVYPKRFMHIFGHHELRNKVADYALTDSDKEFINNTNNDFVFSSEDFISLSQQHFEYLKSAFPSKQVKVIFAWRRSSFKLYSIWQEVIKHGGTESFFSYYHDHMAKPGKSEMLAPDLKLNMFSKVFGKENITVLDYDTSLANDSLIEDFLTVLGADLTRPYNRDSLNPQAQNRSMDIADIEVIRALNYVMNKEYGISGSWVRTHYNRELDELKSVGLDELKEIVLQHRKEIQLGNYFIDHRSEKIMLERYSENIVNYQANLQNKKLLICDGEWAFDFRASQLLSQLAQMLKGVAH